MAGTNTTRVISAADDPRRWLAVSPLRAVLRLAAPTTAVMLVGALSNVLHTYFVSRLGADAIAGVSLVHPISLIVWTVMGGGVGAGVSSSIAHALGGPRPEEAHSLAEHAFLITAIAGVVFTAAMALGGPRLFAALGGEGRALDQAVRFARVLFGGSMVTLLIATLDAVLRGEGNVRVPTICGAISLVLQIALTPLFMFTMGYGIAGAALAAIAGQALGGVPRIIHFARAQGAVRPRLFPRRISLGPVREILDVGIPASLSTLLNYVALLLLTAVVGRYGTLEIAAFGLGTRLDFIIMTLAYGTASAVLTLAGLAAGAGDAARVRAVVLRAMLVVISLMTFVATLLWWRPTIWLGLFTTDPEILSVGSEYLRTVAPTYPFIGGSMVFVFALQGLRRAVFPLALMIVRTSLVVAAAALLVGHGLPVGSIFRVMAVASIVSSVVLGLRLRSVLSVEIHSVAARVAA